MGTSASLNTALLVDSNVREESKELDAEIATLVDRLRDCAERKVRALMHIAVSDALKQNAAPIGVGDGADMLTPRNLIRREA